MFPLLMMVDCCFGFGGAHLSSCSSVTCWDVETLFSLFLRRCFSKLQCLWHSHLNDTPSVQSCCNKLATIAYTHGFWKNLGTRASSSFLCAASPQSKMHDIYIKYSVCIPTTIDEAPTLSQMCCAHLFKTGSSRPQKIKHMEHFTRLSPPTNSCLSFT